MPLFRLRLVSSQTAAAARERLAAEQCESSSRQRCLDGYRSASRSVRSPRIASSRHSRLIARPRQDLNADAALASSGLLALDTLRSLTAAHLKPPPARKLQ